MKLITTFFLLSIVSCSILSASSPAGWNDAQIILKRITPPKFPQRSFSILSFGAKNNGTTDCTEAIRIATDSCNKAGGGKIIFPAGEYLTGPIHLKSNVNLHLEKGAVVKFITDPKKYLPLVFTRYEGMECYNYSPLIYAYEQENIAVTGEGVFDGQGATDNWWTWKGKEEYGWKKGMPNSKNARNKLMKMVEDNVPVAERIFGEGSYLPPNFIQPHKCKNVLISGVTFLNSPMWFIHPLLCENVIVENVTVRGHGPNNDGCNPESSKDVLIKNCMFDTGDDCIAIKSGRNNDGRRINVPSENIIIQDCTMKDGHGGVVIGSEISGSARNVFVENCEMSSPNLDRALRFKTNSVRGGVIENFFARNITVGEVAEAVVLVDFYYEEKDSGPHTPILQNIFIENVTAKKGRYGFFIKGYERSPITNVQAVNCNFTGIEKGNVFENVKNFSFNKVFVNGIKVETPKK